MAKLSNEVLQLRNELGAVIRRGGDVAHARAKLEVAKAVRAITVAVEAGVTDSQRRHMARTALGSIELEEKVDPTAIGTVYFGRRNDLRYVVVARTDTSVTLRDETNAHKVVALSTLKKSYKRDA
jgi:flagellar basal body P-ring protein FlgI